MALVMVPETRPYAKRPAHAVDRQSVRVATKSCYNTGMAPHRVLVHISRSEHRVLDPDDVYFLRTSGGETEIRLRSRTPLIDVRPIGEVAPLFEPFGFVRTHREHAVNIAHIRLLRLQADGRDWELKLIIVNNNIIINDKVWDAGLRAALGELGD